MAGKWPGFEAKCLEHFIPEQCISVDGEVVHLKGKKSFNTYNPIKPTKCGIRIYVVADSKCGYVYSLLTYNIFYSYNSSKFGNSYNY